MSIEYKGTFDRETMMRQWDSWRKYISEGGGGSWPRDAFEALLDYLEAALAAKEAELADLRKKVREWKEAEFALADVAISASTGNIGMRDYRVAMSKFENAKVALRAAVKGEGTNPTHDARAVGWLEELKQLKAALAEKKKELVVSKALEAKFFPQESAYRIVAAMEKAGLGNGPHGNTLLGMAENALEKIVEKEKELADLRQEKDSLSGMHDALIKEHDDLRDRLQKLPRHRAGKARGEWGVLWEDIEAALRAAVKGE